MLRLVVMIVMRIGSILAMTEEGRRVKKTLKN